MVKSITIDRMGRKAVLNIDITSHRLYTKHCH